MVSWLKLLMLIPYLSVSRETFRQVLQVPDFNIVIWFLLKKDIAIKFREANPNNIIVLLSKFENNKSLIIITSKNHDVLNWIDKNNLPIKGGGNKLIWQGVTNQEINLDQIKEWD